MEFKLYIVNDKLTYYSNLSGYTGNVNTYRCLFNIQTDIEGLQWFCVFKTGETVYRQPIVNNACIIPQEVMQDAGAVQIGCYAVTTDEANYKRLSTNWIDASFIKGAYSEATAPEMPSPDVWETLMLKTVPIIGENGNWFIYDITTGDYEDSGKPSTSIVETERLQYYGDVNIIPTAFDSDGNSYFTYKDNLDDNGNADGTITINGYSGLTDGIDTIIVPYKIDNKIVTAIDNYEVDDDGFSSVNRGVFRNVSAKKIILPNSIKIIGKSTFQGADDIKDMIIPNGVTYIDDNAFNGCDSLTTISIPASVTYIGASAFYECTSLKYIELPDSVTYLGLLAFQYCSSLKTVKLGNGVMDLLRNTFAYCNGLTKIIIPDSLSTASHNITGRAFYKCTNLRYVYIFDDNATIHKAAFDGSSNVVLICNPGSTAETYAKENSIPYRYNTVNPSEYATAKEVNTLQTDVNNIKVNLSDKASQSDVDNLQAQADNNSSDITSLQTQMGDIATFLADIQADQEALINGGEE